jgi:hypothetical protein
VSSICALAATLAMACGGPTVSIDPKEVAPLAGPHDDVGRALDALVRLDEEGWLEEFRRGRCMPLHEGETLAAARRQPPTPAAAEPDDIIGELAGVGPPPRTEPCLDAATRFDAVRRARTELAAQTARPDALGRFHRGLRELLAIELDADECALDDPSVSGAVLAVARRRTELAVRPPVRLLSAGRSCWVAGVGGRAWLDETDVDAFFAAREDESLPPDADYPPAVAVDWVEHVCWRGVRDRADGCLEGRSGQTCPRCDGAIECPDGCAPRYPEVVSDEPGTVTVFVSLLRSALGCASTGVRAYEVVRVGGSAGEWRVRREVVLEMGNHGQ